MRTSKNSFNNFEQLNILNQLYEYSSSPRNVYNRSKSKKKVILLEKTSPNHYPVYVKLVKKNNDYSDSPERNINSYTNRGSNNYSFANMTNQNRNSIFTDISSSRKIYNKPSGYFYTNYKNVNKNEYNVNKLKYSLQQPPQQINKSINSNYLRNNRFISISPSNSSKEDTKREASNENDKINEIEVEENIKNDSDYKPKFNNKHKMRILLSKNYNGKKITRGKYITKSPISLMSYIRNNNKNNLKINITNNFKTHENDSYNNIESSSPATLSHATDINQYRLKTGRNTAINRQTPMTTPMQSISTPYLQENSNNIFLNNNYFTNNEVNIKLEDLIFLESRLNDIIIALNNKNNESEINVVNESFEFLTFYYQSSLQDKFPLFFNKDNRIIIKSAFNLNLFIVLIIYHLSLNPSMLLQLILLMRKIFEILKINLFLLIRKIEIYFGEEFCLKNEVYFKNIDYFLKENNLYELKEKEIIELINGNCISITSDIDSILNYYQTLNIKYFAGFQKIYMTISKVTEQEIYDFFNNNLYNNYTEDNIKKNIYINTEKNNDNKDAPQQTDEDKYLDKIILSYKQNKKIPPFLRFRNNKKYTLVLDLEDTLINVKIDNEGKVICRKRPGLIPFLNSIKPFYEIISFTKLSKEYSDSIIKEIEGNKKIFDYNLYREHCVLIGREFIKDISRIGRDIKKIIMVDDLADNLRYYPSNGILIYPYNVDESGEDRVLFELKKLLILFFRLGYEDIRLGLKNHKKEINKKITSLF